MKRKDRNANDDNDGDDDAPDFDITVIDRYIGDLDRFRDELVDVRRRVSEAEMQYIQADDSNRGEREKRLRELIKEFRKTQERIDHYRKVCQGITGPTSQEVDAHDNKRGRTGEEADHVVKMESGDGDESCDVGRSHTAEKGKQLLDAASGSGQSEEKKQEDHKNVQGVSTDVEMAGSDKSDE